MINSFTYNGTNTEELGLFVGGQHTFGAPQRDVTKVSIPGRNGDLVRDNGRFLNSEIMYNIVAMNEFAESAKNVRNWLMRSSGYHRLEDTYDPDHFRMARVAGTVDFETGAYNATGKTQVTFDCMPQRFLKSGETVISGDPVERSASGEIASFETDYVVPISSAEVSLSPKQDLNGYDSPWPGGGGKNLLNPDTMAPGYIEANGNVHAQSSTKEYYSTEYYEVGSQTAISFGYNAFALDESKWIAINWYDANKTNLLRENRVASISTLTPVSGAVYFRVSMRTYDHGVENCYCALGSDTTFSPYSNICPISGHTGAELYVAAEYDAEDKTTYSVTFSDQGTVYGGMYDYVSGKLTVTRKTITLDGSQTINPSQNNRFYVTISDAAIVNASNQTTYQGVISEILPTTSWAGLGYSDGCSPVWGHGVAFKSALYTSASEWTTYFTNNPTVFSYELATPLEYTLSAQQIETLLGENNVWSDAGEISLTFYEPAELENPTLFDSKPLIRAYGSGNGQVTIGNQIIALTDINGYIDIDCEAMDCYNGVENCNSKVTLGAQGFPTLPPGITAVSFGGGVTRVEITPRWWEL